MNCSFPNIMKLSAGPLGYVFSLGFGLWMCVGSVEGGDPPSIRKPKTQQ